MYTFVWVCMHHCAMNVQHVDVTLIGSYIYHDDTFGCVLVWVLSNVVDTSIGMFTYLCFILVHLVDYIPSCTKHYTGAFHSCFCEWRQCDSCLWH